MATTTEESASMQRKLGRPSRQLASVASSVTDEGSDEAETR
eukprot:CAMPEP_0118908426 /NCGR_PEP_ID=MMETSP1166-20130328/11447_1 /TAXON_ID=1104430 /ORGANISM="Chrysoreinhardia sp, Strain CCMP3193" /LENGTH=40 /DNA_ID= /DNA_START= /DNA_END= /DNA_ORIENTATION=